jgi:hypothetical protein
MMVGAATVTVANEAREARAARVKRMVDSRRGGAKGVEKSRRKLEEKGGGNE